MNTIKIYLAESGRVADLQKDFPLYQGAFQNKLLNIFVPVSITEPTIHNVIPNEVTYVGETARTALPTNAELATYVQEQLARAPINGDYVIVKLQAVDTTTPLYYEYVYSATTSEWTQYLLKNETSGDYGSAVQIAMSMLQPNGTIKESNPYFVRYLKNITKDGTTYALYERILPQEFTLFSGQGANAPILTINVVILDYTQAEPKIMRVTTSQTCRLDVMPSTATYDKDSEIATDVATEINARLNEITQTNTEQDKEISTVKNRTNTLYNEQVTQQAQIDKNTQDIARLKMGDYTEDYIGTMSGATLPTTAQLNAYVEEVAKRPVRNGDIIIFVQTIADATDKNYHYFYAQTGWESYEIPPIEKASNENLGVIKGYYSAEIANNTSNPRQVLVDIANGEIQNIYIKNGVGRYVSLYTITDQTAGEIERIKAGVTQVGTARKAIADELGNNIVNTYLTQNAGATKPYVREYALPRIFNDTYYITSGTPHFIKTPPTNSANGVQFTRQTSAVGSFGLVDIANDFRGGETPIEFELSKKNGAKVAVWVGTNRDCTSQLRLTLSSVGATTDTLSIELSSVVNFVAGTPIKVVFDGNFTELGDKVISVNSENGDTIRLILSVITNESTPTTFNVYSNEVYPSVFQLDVATLKTVISQGKLGELPLYKSEGAIENNVVTFPIADELVDKTLSKFVLTFKEQSGGASQ